MTRCFMRPTFALSPFLLLWAAIHAAVSESAIAQTMQRIDASQPTCKTCSIQFSKVATIGSIDDPELPTVSPRFGGLSFDSKGQFVLSDVAGQQLLAYTPSGKFIRTLGRKGDGPGEFHQAVRTFFDAYDSLYVVDIGRVSVFSPDLKYVRTITMPVAMSQSIIAVPNRWVILNHGLTYRGSPLKILSNDGALRLFIQDSSALGSCFACTLVVGNAAAGDRLWSSWNTQYRLQEWRDDGAALRNVSVVNSAWHKGGELVLPGDPNVPPPSVVIALAEDKQHLLWSLGELPVADWTPIPRSKTRTARATRGASNVAVGSVTTGLETLKRMITAIDVFDMTANKLLVSQRFPHRQFRLIAPGYLAEVREDKDGVPVWDIFKVTIKRP